MGWADFEVEERYFMQICTCKVAFDVASELHSHDCNYRLKYMKEAIRNPVNTRYDLLDVDFIDLLAKIAHYGAETYGEGNWMLSRLIKDKGPINHIYKHLRSFRKQIPYDHSELGEGIEIHLAAIAFNAMMEFYWVMKEKENESSG